jgi:hypothetical protein
MLLNRRDLFGRARILFGCGSGRGEAEQLLAVQQPCALGHEAVLARNPLLDFLILGTLAAWLMIAAVTLRTPVFSIVITTAHFLRRLQSI